MRIMMIVVLIATISLSGCSHIAGNVIPQKGPTMEEVYDSMVIDTPKKKPKRQTTKSISTKEFHKLSNPELKMYIYPHLSGKEELPIPGYYTEFNAYTRDHYLLPDESI